MLRRQAQLRTLLLVLADLAATALALTAAYWLRFGSGLFAIEERWEPAWYLRALVPSVLLCVAACAAAGAYRVPRSAGPREGGLRRAAGSVLAATLILAAAALLVRDRYSFSRGMLLLFAPVAVLPVWWGRRIAHGVLAALHRRGVGVSRAVLLGGGPGADRLERSLAEHAWTGIRVARRVEEVDALAAAVAEEKPAQVFVALPANRSDDLAAALEFLSGEMVDVRVVPDLGAEPVAGASVSLVSGLPVVTCQETPFFGAGRILKRGFDLVVTVLLLVPLLPVLALVSLAILLTSGRPVFYHQERMGLDGRRFRIHKFRTMRVNAEDETGAVWAKRGDERCTRLGRVLRRFSIDELPQIVNILKGDMSLVGPRPERPVFIEEFRARLPGYMLRHRIPAGLTGWAQVNGCRGDTDIAERLRHDLAYLSRWSILFDVEILLRTAFHVLSGRNAV